MEEKKDPLFVHLNLSKFKTEPCHLTFTHEPKRCFFYHFELERRRPQNEVSYNKILCANKANCLNDNCKYSHNYIEQIYHVENYKKKYCKDFIEQGKCKYAEYCALAHSDFELKILPLHLLPISHDFLLFRFKSEFCPFSKITHDRFTCVYAHNWQDFKRPFFKELKPVACKNWSKVKEIMEYKAGCPLGMDCENCHGWKEEEYHIANFKKFACKKGQDCDRKEVCSFNHDDRECQSNRIDNPLFSPVASNLAYGSLSTMNYLLNVDVVWPRVSSSSSKSNGDQHFLSGRQTQSGKGCQPSSLSSNSYIKLKQTSIDLQTQSKMIRSDTNITPKKGQKKRNEKKDVSKSKAQTFIKQAKAEPLKMTETHEDQIYSGDSYSEKLHSSHKRKIVMTQELDQDEGYEQHLDSSFRS